MFAIWDQRILSYARSRPSWYGSIERMLEEKHRNSWTTNFSFLDVTLSLRFVFIYLFLSNFRV